MHVEQMELLSEAQWLNLLESSQETPVLVFKHSTRCPISAGAYEEWQAYLANDPSPDVEYAFVRVIQSRPVSDLIASTINVKHESPQVLLVRGRRAVWHASHGQITEEALREAVAQLASRC